VGTFTYIAGKFGYSRGLATATLFAADEDGNRLCYDTVCRLVTVWLRMDKKDNPTPTLAEPHKITSIQHPVR
jgi:hypothetical protein